MLSNWLSRKASKSVVISCHLVNHYANGYSCHFLTILLKLSFTIPFICYEHQMLFLLLVKTVYPLFTGYPFFMN